VSERKDPVDRLRAANPVPKGSEPTADSPVAQALFHRIVSEPAVAERAPKRRFLFRAWILVPIAVVGLAAAGYGIYRAVRQPLVVACYQGPSLSTTREGVAASTTDALANCMGLWRPGGRFNARGTQPVPDLTACVLDDGTVGVFPQPAGTDTCSLLGLAPARPGAGGSDQQAVVDLQNAVADRFIASCVDRPEAIAFLRSQLQHFHLEGWRVDASVPFTSGRPCASAAYDLAARTIDLVPIPRPSSP
jgi:hypothetical protein